MQSNKTIGDLAEPRVETGRAMKLAGLTDRFNGETCTAIPSLWESFCKYMGNVPGQTGDCSYGAKFDGGKDGFFNYMCAVEVSHDAPELPELHYREVPAQTYLVFTHSGHVSAIRQTCEIIWDKYFPQSQYKPAKGTEFELYDERFEPDTGGGTIEIWIPIQV